MWHSEDGLLAVRTFVLFFVVWGGVSNSRGKSFLWGIELFWVITIFASLPRDSDCAVKELEVAEAAAVDEGEARTSGKEVGDKDREDFLRDLGGIPLRLRSPLSSSTVDDENLKVRGVIIFFKVLSGVVFFFDDNLVNCCCSLILDGGGVKLAVLTVSSSTRERVSSINLFKFSSQRRSSCCCFSKSESDSSFFVFLWLSVSLSRWANGEENVTEIAALSVTVVVTSRDEESWPKINSFRRSSGDFPWSISVDSSGGCCPTPSSWGEYSDCKSWTAMFITSLAWSRTLPMGLFVGEEESVVGCCCCDWVEGTVFIWPTGGQMIQLPLPMGLLIGEDGSMPE
jgi:hypothetical protein